MFFSFDTYASYLGFGFFDPSVRLYHSNEPLEPYSVFKNTHPSFEGRVFFSLCTSCTTLIVLLILLLPLCKKLVQVRHKFSVFYFWGYFGWEGL